MSSLNHLQTNTSLHMSSRVSTRVGAALPALPPFIHIKPRQADNVDGGKPPIASHTINIIEDSDIL